MRQCVEDDFNQEGGTGRRKRVRDPTSTSWAPGRYAIGQTHPVL
ncbi:hypothetical protein SCAR479_13031 [Seiridium cardinale]|uniref:Uncharacterized protein n=1 Tax=Seiridium cardinale TaxID=138064 RepID=A0ABR2X979_9PEZI